MNHGELADLILEADLPALQKIVLLGYLKHRNKKTGLSWPGAKTLAKYASTSRQVVMRHRTELIEKGWLVVVKQVPGKPMVVSIRHQGGASPAPQVVPLRHPNLLNKPTKEPTKEIADMTRQESWDKWNELRKQLDPKYRSSWKLKTWGKHWDRCLKDHSAEEVLAAFKYFWTSDDTEWWRENRPNPSQSFLNGSTRHMSGWVQSAKDAEEEETNAVDNREDTCSFVLARIWIRRNRAQIELAMHKNQLEDYLEEHVNSPGHVLMLLGVTTDNKWMTHAAGGE